MKTRNVTYLKVYFISKNNQDNIYCFDRKDAGELFDLLVRLEKHDKGYRIDVCKEKMLVTGEEGALCMK